MSANASAPAIKPGKKRPHEVHLDDDDSHLPGNGMIVTMRARNLPRRKRLITAANLSIICSYTHIWCAHAYAYGTIQLFHSNDVLVPVSEVDHPT